MQYIHHQNLRCESWGVICKWRTILLSPKSTYQNGSKWRLVFAKVDALPSTALSARAEAGSVESWNAGCWKAWSPNVAGGRKLSLLIIWTYLLSKKVKSDKLMNYYSAVMKTINDLCHGYTHINPYMLYIHIHTYTKTYAYAFYCFICWPITTHLRLTLCIRFLLGIWPHAYVLTAT